MKLPSLLIASLASVLLTGCQSGGAKPPLNTTKYNLESTSKFVLLDSRAQRSVTCTGLQERPLEDGRLEVAANIRNRENRRIEVQIDCQFKDEQGFMVEEVPFRPIFLAENEQRTVRFVSMNNKPRTYTIRVRSSR